MSKFGHLKGKMAVQIWTREGGAMLLHIGRKWSMRQITDHIDDECSRWEIKDDEGRPTGRFHTALTAETYEFGKNSSPKRRFDREANDKWIELKSKPWPKWQTRTETRVLQGEIVQQIFLEKKP